MTAEQKKQIKRKLLLDVKNYAEQSAAKSEANQEIDVEMFMIKMTLDNIEKLDQYPNE